MNSYKLAWFKDKRTNQVFATSIFSGELIERIFKGEVEIIKVETITYPEILNSFELEVLYAHEKGEKIPPSLTKYLENAIRKRKELLEYQEKMENLPREKK